MHHPVHISWIYFHTQVSYWISLLRSASSLTSIILGLIQRRKWRILNRKNHELHEEVTALKAGMANLTALMESLVAAQNQPQLAQPHKCEYERKTLVSSPTVSQITLRHAILNNSWSSIHKNSRGFSSNHCVLRLSNRWLILSSHQSFPQSSEIAHVLRCPSSFWN